jgi:diacylglycerol kinase family enzyme
MVRIVNHPLVWQGRARRVDFEMESPIGVMVDGEVMSLQCESLEVLPSALDVLI